MWGRWTKETWWNNCVFDHHTKFSKLIDPFFGQFREDHKTQLEIFLSTSLFETWSQLVEPSRMVLTLAATGSDPVAPLWSCLITSPSWPWFCGEIKIPVNWQLQIVFRKPKKSRFIILSSSVSPVHMSGNVAWKSSNSPWDRTSKAPFLNFEAIWFINGNKSWRSLNWTPRRNDDKALGSSTRNYVIQWNSSSWSAYRECRSSSK